MKLSFFALATLIVMLATATASAQFGGCVDSPENPTLILAGLATGGYAVNQMRLRVRSRRKSRQICSRKI